MASVGVGKVRVVRLPAFAFRARHDLCRGCCDTSRRRMDHGPL